MPKAEITSVTVSQIWDDSSPTQTTIEKYESSDGIPFVSIDQEGQGVSIYPESWPEIKKQVDLLMNSILEHEEYFFVEVKSDE